MARPSLIAAHTIELPQGSKAPDWVKILPYGTVMGRDGRGPYTLADQSAARSVIAATNAYRRSADLPIDYEHQILRAEFNGKPAPAAGWIKELAARDDGLWGRVEWTAAGAAQVEAGEYRYFSPVFKHRAGGAVTRLACGALTNLPNLELTALAAAELSPEEDTMDPELAKALRVALGLAPDAPDDKLTAAAQALADKAAGLSAVAKALGQTETTAPEALAAAAQTLVERTKATDPDPAKYVPIAIVKELSDRLAAMSQSLATDRATEAVEKAKAAGKVSPAMEGWAAGYAAKDPDGFTAWCSAAPVIVTPGEAGTKGKPPAGDTGLSDEETAVCSQLGLTADEFKKSRGDA